MPDHHVILTTKPDGCLSSSYPLTLGKQYKVVGRMGSCLVVETDIEGETASVHASRFTPVMARQ